MEDMDKERHIMRRNKEKRTSCRTCFCGVILLGVSVGIMGCAKPTMAGTMVPETTIEATTEAVPETTVPETTEPETTEEFRWGIAGDESQWEKRTTTNKMLLYAEPEDGAEVLCEIPAGVEVTYKGEVFTKEGDSSPFICIEYEGKTGYTFWEIFSDPIIEETTAEETTESEAETEKETEAETKKAEQPAPTEAEPEPQPDPEPEPQPEPEVDGNYGDVSEYLGAPEGLEIMDDGGMSFEEAWESAGAEVDGVFDGITFE